MNKNFSAPFRFINLGYFFTLVFHPIVYADTVLTYTPKPSNLEEVVVTSQRREQSLSSIPLAVSVINSQLITKASLNSLSEIASLIPNLQIAQPNGDVLPIFSIRGVSMADYSTNQSSPIGVYQDGVYLSANYMNGMTLFDLERVEVIKGPQGTLFGKNTTGGAIQLISKTPDFEADGNLKLSLGNYNAYELKAAYETPLIDQKLALRVAANIAKADGYSENHAPGQDDLSAVDRQAFKATLLYQANDDLEAVLRLYSSRSDANAPAVIPEASIATAFGNIDVASLVLAGASQPFYVRPASYDGHDADANKVGKMAIEKDGISLNVHWQQGNINFNSITGYYNGRYDLQADSDGTPLQVLELGYLSENKQFSQEFIISSEQSEPFGYIAGIYFSQDSVDTEVYYDFFHSWQTIAPAFNPGGALTTELPPSGLTQVQRYEQDRKSQALFGQINYDLSNALTITAGLRYTKDHGKQFNVHTYTADYAGTPIIGLIPFNIPYDPDAVYPSQRINDEEWTGTLKLDYQLNDSHLTYASYSPGYRGSAFNGAAVNDISELDPAPPETINAWEVGAKGQWLEGKISYSSALFYYDYRNLQFINIVGVTQRLESADRASIKGLELELQAQATDKLTLTAGLGLIDSEFKDDLTLFAQGQSQDLSGNDLPNAPEFNANVSANYRINFSAGELNTFINYSYVDDQWFTAFNDSAGYEPIGESSYDLIDARMSFSPTNSPINVALWGKNLTDTEYKLYGINLSESFGYNYTIRGAPRTYGIEISTVF